MKKENKIYVYEIEDFRKWLEKNHEKESKVTVILHKKHTGKMGPSHNEQIREAICFGWIDTTAKRIDEDTFLRNFVKRKKSSTWSDNTLGYAKELVEQGRMKPQGMHFYKLGLAKPTHDFGIPKNPEMPDELKKELEKNPIAKENFNNFSASVKRTFYRWFLRAKLPETKEKRLKKIVDLAVENKKVF